MSFIVNIIYFIVNVITEILGVARCTRHNASKLTQRILSCFKNNPKRILLPLYHTHIKQHISLQQLLNASSRMYSSVLVPLCYCKQEQYLLFFVFFFFFFVYWRLASNQRRCTTATYCAGVGQSREKHKILDFPVSLKNWKKTYLCLRSAIYFGD